MHMHAVHYAVCNGCPDCSVAAACRPPVCKTLCSTTHIPAMPAPMQHPLPPSLPCPHLCSGHQQVHKCHSLCCRVGCAAGSKPLPGQEASPQTSTLASESSRCRQGFIQGSDLKQQHQRKRGWERCLSGTWLRFSSMLRAAHELHMNCLHMNCI